MPKKRPPRTEGERARHSTLARSSTDRAEGMGREPSTVVTYGSYLALADLLTLQRPRSKPEHPDELLFIVVHQSSELWFKVLLRDLDTLATAFQKRDGGLALWQVQRINGMMRIVSAQLSSLALLPPQHFAQFRAHLGSSSGSQSVQFRAIEAASGLREKWFVDMLREQGRIPDAIQRWIDRPTLILISRQGSNLFLTVKPANG